jgi:hypothetical protein
MFPVSRAAEQCECSIEELSVILWGIKFNVNRNRLAVQLFTFAEISHKSAKIFFRIPAAVDTPHTPWAWCTTLPMPNQSWWISLHFSRPHSNPPHSPVSRHAQGQKIVRHSSSKQMPEVYWWSLPKDILGIKACCKILLFHIWNYRDPRIYNRLGYPCASVAIKLMTVRIIWPVNGR